MLFTVFTVTTTQSRCWQLDRGWRVAPVGLQDGGPAAEAATGVQKYLPPPLSTANRGNWPFETESRRNLEPSIQI